MRIPTIGKMALATLTLAACMAGCDGGGRDDDDDGSEARAGSVTLDSPTLMAGQTTRATLRDTTGTAVDGASVTWSSSDPDVASVSPSGFVTTFASGDVTISGRSDTAQAGAALAIGRPPDAVPFRAVVEMSPTVVPVPAGGGAAVIVDGVATTTGVTLTLPVFPNEVIPTRAVAGTKRFVADLTEAQASPEPLGERCLVNACFVGTLTITDADPAKTETRQLFVPYVAPDASLVVPVLHDAEVQSTSYVVNVRNDRVRQDPNTPEVARAFYRWFPDAFEYLSDVEVAAPINFVYFESLRNRVSGTGVALYDFSADYGASPSGALMGVVNWPDAYLRTGAAVTTHEMGHAFMNFLRSTDYAPGVPHWPLSSTAFGIMGIVRPNNDLKLTALGDDRYRIDPETPPSGLNDLELYLFGLADPSEVGDQIVFADRDQEVVAGNVLHGPVSHVTIDDVVAAYGPRVPAWTGTPVTFHMATIVVSRGRLLTPRELTYYDRAAREGEAATASEFDLPFGVATGGRGILVTRLR